MKYALAYNEFHNLESIGIEGKDEKLIKYAYKNGNGRLKQMTYANGHTMKAVYNSIGQIVAEKWFETVAKAADSTATPIAHYKYVYDGDGNIVRSIDISGKKEYYYEYEEGRIVRATQADIQLSGEIVTSKVIVNTVKYYYNKEIELYYVSSRYYDPEIGRFINADIPEILTVLLLAEHVIVSNLFAYCKNNPVTNYDLLGCASIAAEANWLVNALFGSIMALKLSGAALATKVSAMILAIAPYLFWIVVAVAAVVITYFIAKSAVVSKADSKIKNIVRKNSKDRYWTATLRTDYVDIGRAISYSTAVKEVSNGRNVFTVTNSEAKAVAIAAYSNKKPYGPEIHGGGALGYYYHYHVYDHRKNGHVFFLFW